MKSIHFSLWVVLILCFSIFNPAQVVNAHSDLSVSHTLKKKKKGKNKAPKFKKTGTSADPFLKSTFDLNQKVNSFNTSYDNAWIYLAELVNAPANMGTKSLEDAIKSPTAKFDNAESMIAAIEAKKDDISAAIGANTAILDYLKGFIVSLTTATTDLATVPTEASTLLQEGTSLPGKLNKELTGMDKRKLPGATKAVNQANKDLASIQTESPKMVSRITELVGIVKMLVE